MFSEIVYTRCGNGRDLVNGGRARLGEGYKVYSCSEELFQDGSVKDFRFVQDMVGAKLPFAEAELMDDAYAYYVPDAGSPLLECFHPIPYAAGGGDGYSHRAGNFISQTFVGRLHQYPCEAFGSPAWDAKEKGEAYYYGSRENSVPPFLPQRGDILQPGGLTFQKAGAFIADGRKDALKAAVWFVISQLSQPPEQRKYLIVKDTTDNIELWIAAIGYAFSAGLACTIPFATRMSKATMANRYTVGGDGLFCPVIDLQDKNQKGRLRALIVGANIRDRESMAAVRPMPAAPYVVLDGTQKAVLFETDESIRDPYYELITRFDDIHLGFCAFLAELQLDAVSSRLYEIGWAYAWLYMMAPDIWTGKEIAQALSILQQYQQKADSGLQALLVKVRTYFKALLLQDEASGQRIADWMSFAAKLLGISAEQEIFTGGAWSELIGMRLLQSASAPELIERGWQCVRQQPASIQSVAAQEVAEDSNLDAYFGIMKEAQPAYGKALLQIYANCLRILKQPASAAGQAIIRYALERGIKDRDAGSVRQLLADFAGSADAAERIVFPVLSALQLTESEAAFVWQCLTDVAIGSYSAADMETLCDTMCRKGFSHGAEYIYAARLRKGGSPDALCGQFRKLYAGKALPYPAGYALFSEWIRGSGQYSQLVHIFKTAETIGLHTQTTAELFGLLDHEMPEETNLNPANVRHLQQLCQMAPKGAALTKARRSLFLYELKANRRGREITDVLLTYLQKGVPVDADFIRTRYCAEVMNEVVPYMGSALQHLMLLLAFRFPEGDAKPAQSYCRQYVETAVSLARKDQRPVVELIRMIMLYDAEKSAGRRPQTQEAEVLHQIRSACGDARVEDVCRGVEYCLPYAYANSASDKLNSRLYKAAEEYRDPQLNEALGAMIHSAERKRTKEPSMINKLFDMFKGDRDR